ncbi:Prohibitin-2 [Seminavis robusta]|uniref:Prohibitin n=1 Tax=Seminavis robusta TaxID=568900 RepID=A0A9N8DR13_9STRA|nr:Prohibitin-2 [Seminavis robusta]|eukprot:Sro194_g083040.1 Prohibitin-2 (304) ;mRNA; f:85711-86797
MAANRLREAMKNLGQQMGNMGGGGGGGGKRGGGGGAQAAAAAAARSVGAIAVATGLGYGAYNSIYTVQGGHRAVVFNRIVGMKDTVYGEGLNFNIPWFERPIIYDIRTRPVNLQTLTGIGLDLPIFGLKYDERILPSVMNECAKAVVARYNANELLTKRDLVSREISVELRKRAGFFNVLLEDVAITHLSFSPEYARAVEAKQVAQQDAERAKYVVIGAQQEKKTIITKAKGEAESASLIGNAVKRNPGFMKLRRIDAARDIADIVAGSGNKVYLNADSLLLNLLGDADDKFERSVQSKRRLW